MRHAKTTIALALVVIGAFLSTTPAGARSGAPSCTATVGKVTEVNGKVRAPAVPVSCRGAWSAHESLQYIEVDGFTAYGKWSYGGDKTVTGRGNATLPAFTRDYHEGCTSWRLRVVLNGVAFNGPANQICT